MLKRRVALGDMDRPEYQVAPYLDISQLVPPFGKCLVERRGIADIRCILDPIAAFDALNGLVCRAQLRPVFAQIVHIDTPEI